MTVATTKYLIQIFRLTEAGSNVGVWKNTAFETTSFEHAKTIAEKIAKSNKQRITKVRVVEVLLELDCKSNDDDIR